MKKPIYRGGEDRTRDDQSQEAPVSDYTGLATNVSNNKVHPIKPGRYKTSSPGGSVRPQH